MIMDIWSTRSNQSVIGFKVQLIRNWKLVQLVLGFEDFPESHTAINIRKKLNALLTDRYKLKKMVAASIL